MVTVRWWVKESMVTVRAVGKGSMIAQASMCSKYSCMGHT